MSLQRRASRHASRAIVTALPSEVTLPAVHEQTHRRSARLLQTFFESRSDLTAQNYRIDLVHFSRWWRAGGHLVEETRTLRTTTTVDLAAVAVPVTVGARDEFVAAVLMEFYQLASWEAVAVVVSYQYDLKSGALGQVYAPNTINRRVTAIRAVTSLARMLGICELSLDQIKLVPTTLTRNTAGCGEDDVRKIADLLDEEFASAKKPSERRRSLRDRLLVVFLYDLGLRRFESIQPRWPDDIDLANGRLRFRGKRRPAPEWHDVLDENAVAVINEYLDVRGRQKGYLVHGEDVTQPLHVRTVNKIIARVSKRTGVRVTPHGFRHSATTILLEKTDGNVRTVAAFLRHKSLNTVQIYDDARRGLAKKMSSILSSSRKASSPMRSAGPDEPL